MTDDDEKPDYAAFRQTGKTDITHIRGLSKIMTKEEMKEFFSTGYIDPKGCHWESFPEYFFCGVLGGCGCGTSDEIAAHAWTIFGLIAAKKNQDLIKEHTNPYTEVLLHWMDSKGLIEHGGMIWGSWLSDEGKKIQAAALEAANDA